MILSGRRRDIINYAMSRLRAEAFGVTEWTTSEASA